MSDFQAVRGGGGMTRGHIKWIIIVAAIVLAALLLVTNGMYTVNEGFYAAVYTMGKLDVLESRAGLHLKIPFVQSVSMINVKEQSIEIPHNAYTKDTQTVENLAVKINYRLDTAALDSTIREIGVENVYSTVIEPNVLSATRNTIGQYAADELIGHRAEISQNITDQLVERFTGKGVELVTFTIQNIDFEDSFEAAVQRKVEAEQKALEAQNKTRETEELGKQRVISAQADADSIKAKADADAYAIEAKANAEANAMQVLNQQLEQNPAYIEYLKVTLWNGQLPVVDGGGANPIIDMRDLQSAASARPAGGTAATPAPEAEPQE